MAKHAKPNAPLPTIRDRIKELRRVPASLLRANHQNWKHHPPKQREQLAKMLAKIGFAGACLARELDDGSLELLDGHLRADLSKDELIPVLVLDVDEFEGKEILATFDPMGYLAECNDILLNSLLHELDAHDDELKAIVSEHRVAEEAPVELMPISIKPPPKLSWALVAIPATKFGEIAELVERIAEVEGAVVETCVSD